MADGTYVNAQNSQLTTVSVLTPMWINFSLSENEMERIRDEVQKGQLRLPRATSSRSRSSWSTASLFPHKGRITFADPSYNSQTGTFLIRASVDNPKGVLRPNQYVRTRLHGAIRPNAILVPQRAVQQGAKGHFVWVVNKDEQGRVAAGRRRRLVRRQLVHRAGPRRRRPGRRRRRAPARAGGSVKVTRLRAEAGFAGSRAARRARPARRWSSTSRRATAALDAEAMRLLKGFAPAMKAGTNPIDVTGFADRTGNRAANVELAKRRAIAVRDALVAEGIARRPRAPQAAAGRDRHRQRP